MRSANNEVLCMKSINEDIKNNSFKQVYLLYGEEAYLKRMYKEKLRNALVEKVSANTEVQVPEAMVQHQIDNMLMELNYQLQYQGLNLDQLLQMTGRGLDELREERRACNSYLAGYEIVDEVPADTVFEVGPDAPFYRIDPEGNVYMQVLVAGDKSKRPVDNQPVPTFQGRQRPAHHPVGDGKAGGAGCGDTREHRDHSRQHGPV